MNKKELQSVIFHTDTGSCLKVLVDSVSKDQDIFNTKDEEFKEANKIHARSIIRRAKDEGYLRGDPDWLKVTDKGWDWNKN